MKTSSFNMFFHIDMMDKCYTICLIVHIYWSFFSSKKVMWIFRMVTISIFHFNPFFHKKTLTFKILDMRWETCFWWLFSLAWNEPQLKKYWEAKRKLNRAVTEIHWPEWLNGIYNEIHLHVNQIIKKSLILSA